MCVPLLLENGADPNAVCNSKYAPGKTLQFHVNGHGVSNVKLLALYGANADGIKFTYPTQYLKQLILDKHRIYLHRKELEQLANQETSLLVLIGIYEKLKKLWAKESEDELEPTYKKHYEQKANMCQQKIIALTARTADTNEKDNMPAVEQELTPLLQKPFSNQSKPKFS